MYITFIIISKPFSFPWLSSSLISSQHQITLICRISLSHTFGSPCMTYNHFKLWNWYSTKCWPNNMFHTWPSLDLLTSFGIVIVTHHIIQFINPFICSLAIKVFPHYCVQCSIKSFHNSSFFIWYSKKYVMLIVFSNNALTPML